MSKTETEQHKRDAAQAREIQRLKRDYVARRAANRPLPYSIAIAYRQRIAQCEKERRQKPGNPAQLSSSEE